MKQRKTISEVFTGGVIAQMAHINAEKVGALFPTEQDIKDFDFYFLSRNGERKISNSLDWAVKTLFTENYLSSLLFVYYPNWAREKEALEAEYDLLWTGGGDSKTTETHHEAGTNKGKTAVQNALNAFNGETASDTDSQTRDDEGEHDITTTVERSVERKENSVSYTQAEVVEKELNLRMKYRLYEIIAGDIARECCMQVY